MIDMLGDWENHAANLWPKSKNQEGASVSTVQGVDSNTEAHTCHIEMFFSALEMLFIIYFDIGPLDKSYVMTNTHALIIFSNYVTLYSIIYKWFCHVIIKALRMRW